MSRRARERAAAVAIKRLAFAPSPDDDRHLEDDEADGLDWNVDEFDSPFNHSNPTALVEGRPQ